MNRIILSKEHEKILDKTLKIRFQDNPLFRANILAYEAQDVGRVIARTTEHVYNPAYEAELKIALGDVVAQYILLANLYNLDINEILKSTACRFSLSFCHLRIQ